MDDLKNETESTRPVRDYVLVHGGWGGRWCWDGVARRLEAAGDRVHVPTLTGLGERANEATSEVGMTTHVEDVMRVILDHDLTEVELVGHSYGGMPVTGAAHRVPERVAHVVYLDALVPTDGQSCADVLGPEFVDAARAAMAAAGTPHSIPWLFTAEQIFGVGPAADEIAARMTPQPVRTLFEPVAVPGPGPRRRTYVYCGAGPALGLTEGFAAAARTSPAWNYAELPCPHDALHAMPAAVAGLLESLAAWR